MYCRPQDVASPVIGVLLEFRAVVAGVLSLCIVSCSVGTETVQPEDDVSSVAAAIINGDDDRAEYFEVKAPEFQRVVAQSVVALMPSSAAQAILEDRISDLRTLEVSRRLCPGQRFGDQPASAYCSGVLVDWDLVLTVAHCASELPLEDVRVIFGYYYIEDAHLAVGPGDVYGVGEVVASGDADNDYAWIRLDRRANSPRSPAAIYTQSPSPQKGDHLFGVSTTAGIPLKLDASGTIFDAREAELDYFVADTDTFEGSSGGGAFALDLGLMGILSRGAPDYQRTEERCMLVRQRASAVGVPEERFTYAHRAIAGLCRATSTALCDSDCEQPCRVPARSPTGGGCTVGSADSGSRAPRLKLWVLALSLFFVRKPHQRCRTARSDS